MRGQSFISLGILLWFISSNFTVNAQEGELLGTAPRHFGYAVAISGDDAVVGRPAALPWWPLSGSVVIYKRRHGAWEESTRLPAPHGANAFGSAIAMQTDVILVGAPQFHAGAAYVFERRYGVWLRKQLWTPRASERAKSFGSAVALTGAYAFVGASSERQGGAVYVFRRHPHHGWSAQALQKLLPGDAASKRDFGFAIAAHGNTVVVGAPPRDTDDHHHHNVFGAVYVFELRHGQWDEVARLTAPGPAAPDAFGTAVVLSDQYILVGDPQRANTGVAYVFARRDGLWQADAVHTLTASDGRPGDQFGAAVALNDSGALVGAPGREGQDDEEDGPHGHHGGHHPYHHHQHPGDHHRGDHHQDNNHKQSGAAYFFTQGRENWEEVLTLTEQPAVDQARFGFAVALSAQEALIGAPALSPERQGRAYVYSNLFANQAPTIVSTPVTVAAVGTLYTAQIMATDADGDPLVYVLRTGPLGMAIDQTGQLTWTPETPGNVDVLVAVEDGHGGSAIQAFTITVASPNTAPQIVSQPVTTAQIFHVIPQISITDPHLAQQHITLNGYPYTPGSAISVPGAYELVVEATDVAGNTTITTIHFTLQSPAAP